MRRAAILAVVAFGVMGVAVAGEKKLPRSLSLVERQPEAVEPHASLEPRETPLPLSLVERQPEDVEPHPALLVEER
jgi:hypothetical protein